ncbi:MAG: SoxR reducing system RseC family protein [Bacteroidales bacterium]|nr:SoxR reducing system RseC family protein [Bacteroidales bacterium]
MNELQTDCSIDAIKHEGIVSKMDDDQYYITIVAQSACAACHAKGVCNVTDLQQEVIEVPRNGNTKYGIGDKVEVLMEKTQGSKAVLLGYFLPFLILLSSLIITTNLMVDEGLSGLISIGILVPYYLVLYLNRDKLKKKFIFKIRGL